MHPITLARVFKRGTKTVSLSRGLQPGPPCCLPSLFPCTRRGYVNSWITEVSMAGSAAYSRQRALSCRKTRPTCDCDFPLASVCPCCFRCSCSTAAICFLTCAAACLTASALRMSSLAVASSTCRLQQCNPPSLELHKIKEVTLTSASGQRLWEWLHSTSRLWVLQGSLNEHALNWHCRPCSDVHRLDACQQTAKAALGANSLHKNPFVTYKVQQAGH